MANDRRTDVLGDPYTVETIVLADDDEGPVEATLVHRGAERDRIGAVLHVHGFADYFFHTEYAQWWTGRGYDFYALDLRKYGRSLREHQTPNYVDDLATYAEELDAAWSRIRERDGHEHVVLSAHSTGGLIAALWAHDRELPLAGSVFNSPWLDLQGSRLLRNPVTGQVIAQIGARQPRRRIRRAIDETYGRSLHRNHGGEWDYDLTWKPLDSWPIFFGWLRAVRRGQAQLHRGLALHGPVLVLTSGSTVWPKDPADEAVHHHDVVLDVEQIRQRAPQLGKHLTIASIDGARHDVVLSRPEVRARVYAELERWSEAYLPR